MSTEMTKTLRDRVKEFDSRLPLMEGKEKGETKELLGSVNTIIDYGFLPNDKGAHYAVFTVKERPRKFYFGGTVLTDRLAQLDGEGYGDEIRKEGLPMLMTERRTRDNKRTFTDVTFYPED